MAIADLDVAMLGDNRASETRTPTEMLAHYQVMLERVEKDRSKLKKDEVLSLLLARDEVEAAFNVKPDEKSIELLCLFDVDEKLSGLDHRLKKLGDVIANTISLDKWCTRLQREEAAWWWQFKPARKVDAWDRVDWLWDALTLGTLALGASFMVSIISALSVGSLTVTATLSTIAQIGGLAIVSQGALTKRGQEKVRDFMTRFKIAARFQSEVMLMMAALLLLTVYITHNSLTTVYLEQGRDSYSQGALNDAELTFLRGLEIAPSNSTFNAELGRIYESLGVLNKAIDQYYLNVQAGGVKGINDLGRTYINWVNPVTRKSDHALAEAYLQMGLQRANAQQAPDQDLRYQLNRNLGWALLKQDKFIEAEAHLKTAISIDERIPGNQIGGGMAYCFLAYVYEKEGNKNAANIQWGNCVVKARPETIHEYRWFSEVRRGDVAACVNTSKIVSGLDDSIFDGIQATRCASIISKGQFNASEQVATIEE
ncbi:MAG: tetratricopeptide repeat protein [Thiotrichaceae bacterium]|nr:tetratricopeptide repeat protein [Thiotrichaceae bacterium]